MKHSVSPVVTSTWLAEHINDDTLRVVDASWHMPAAKRDAQSEYANGHIPGAVFFDIDKHSAPSELPHMLPEAEQFAAAAGALGISDQHVIVVYDTLGIFSAARVWWMFRHFGAAQVYVLDGGLPAWQDGGHELVAGESVVSSTTFTVRSTEEQRMMQVLSAQRVLNLSNVPDALIVDARAHARFTGEQKEPRAGLRSGHIPGSVSLPFTRLLKDDGTLLNVGALKLIFEDLGVKETTRIVTTCGSGVTAAVICLALHSAGYERVALYDGSWSEWGALEQLPVATC